MKEFFDVLIYAFGGSLPFGAIALCLFWIFEKIISKLNHQMILIRLFYIFIAMFAALGASFAVGNSNRIQPLLVGVIWYAMINISMIYKKKNQRENDSEQ